MTDQDKARADFLRALKIAFACVAGLLVLLFIGEAWL